MIAGATLDQTRQAFLEIWGLQPGEIKLGYMRDGDGGGGPGLSRDGDTVILYDGHVTGSDVVDMQSFPVSDRRSYILNPDDLSFGELAEDGRFGAREGLRQASDLVSQPPVASPGIVPEPASVALLACAALAGIRHRR